MLAHDLAVGCEYCEGTRHIYKEDGYFHTEVFNAIPDSWWDDTCTACGSGRIFHFLPHPHRGTRNTSPCDAFIFVIDKSFED